MFVGVRLDDASLERLAVAGDGYTRGKSKRHLAVGKFEAADRAGQTSRQQNIIARVAANRGVSRFEPEKPADTEPAVFGLQIGQALLPPPLDLVAVAVLTGREPLKSGGQNGQEARKSRSNPLHDRSPGRRLWVQQVALYQHRRRTVPARANWRGDSRRAWPLPATSGPRRVAVLRSRSTDSCAGVSSLGRHYSFL